MILPVAWPAMALLQASSPLLKSNFLHQSNKELQTLIIFRNINKGHQLLLRQSNLLHSVSPHRTRPRSQINYDAVFAEVGLENRPRNWRRRCTMYHGIILPAGGSGSPETPLPPSCNRQPRPLRALSLAPRCGPRTWLSRARFPASPAGLRSARLHRKQQLLECSSVRAVRVRVRVRVG